MKKLFLIPARSGSKGLPGKNIKSLAGKPMIEYTLEAAIGAKEEGDEICVSTDDALIINVVESFGIQVPFVRPQELSSDTARTQDVISHALSWYKAKKLEFDLIVLLQVTSPLRKTVHIKEALALWDDQINLVVSVKETDSNPYYVLFEEDSSGFLQKSKTASFSRRQDCPRVYEYNGAIYIFKPHHRLSELSKTIKYVMSKESSVDIDDIIDFKLAECILKET